MAKPKSAPGAGDAPRAKKKSPVPISAIVALVAVIPVGYMAFNSFKGWKAVRDKAAKHDSEMAGLTQRNTELAKVYEAVSLKKYQACNKTAEQITLNWVVAAYHDGKRVRIFDSERCTDWQPVVLMPGDNKNLLLRSSQPGCNWDGSVFYYAMRYTQESEEKYTMINVAGAYQGFERDCYTFQ